MGRRRPKPSGSRLRPVPWAESVSPNMVDALYRTCCTSPSSLSNKLSLLIWAFLDSLSFWKDQIDANRMASVGLPQDNAALAQWR